MITALRHLGTAAHSSPVPYDTGVRCLPKVSLADPVNEVCLRAPAQTS